MQLWTFGQEKAVGKNWKYRHFLFQGFPKLLPFFSHGLFQLLSKRECWCKIWCKQIFGIYFPEVAVGLNCFPWLVLSSFGLLANWKGGKSPLRVHFGDVNLCWKKGYTPFATCVTLWRAKVLGVIIETFFFFEKSHMPLLVCYFLRSIKSISLNYFKVYKLQFSERMFLKCNWIREQYTQWCMVLEVKYSGWWKVFLWYGVFMW